MKKQSKVLIALGLTASLALLPIGAFATDDNLGTDQVTVTVRTGCSLFAADGESDFSALSNVYSGSVAPGETLEITAGGSGKINAFNVKCNEDGTYAISARATALTHTNGEYTIPVNSWGLKYNGNSEYTMFNGNSQTLVSKSGTATGSNELFTINGYKVNTTASTKSGAYTGTVTYTLVFDGE